MFQKKRTTFLSVLFFKMFFPPPPPQTKPPKFPLFPPPPPPPSSTIQSPHPDNTNRYTLLSSLPQPQNTTATPHIPPPTHKTPRYQTPHGISNHLMQHSHTIFSFLSLYSTPPPSKKKPNRLPMVPSTSPLSPLSHTLTTTQEPTNTSKKTDIRSPPQKAIRKPKYPCSPNLIFTTYL